MKLEHNLTDITCITSHSPNICHSKEKYVLLDLMPALHRIRERNSNVITLLAVISSNENILLRSNRDIDDMHTILFDEVTEKTGNSISLNKDNGEIRLSKRGRYYVT